MTARQTESTRVVALARSALFGLVLFCASHALAEDTEDKHAHAIIATINAGGGFESAARKHFSEDMLARRGAGPLAATLEMLSHDLAPARIATIETLEDGRRKFALETSGMGWVDMIFSFDEQSGNRVAGFSAAPGAPPLDTEHLPETLAEAVEAYLSERVAENGFAGAVLLARADETVFSRAYGMADIAAGRRNTLDTPINIGSMNKMFTAVAIGQLAEAGKLSYKDTVGEHLPGYPDAPVAESVTIHHLLTHTSGLGHYWNDRYEAHKAGLETTSDFAALCVGDPLLFEPGDRMEYSNCGPVVLGLIIEKVSGLDYYEYVRRNIYRPAGMWHSDHYLLTDGEAGFATGYLPEGDAWVSNESVMGLRGSPAGGGYASANDLLGFSRALMGSKLLGAKYREQLLEGKIDMGPGVRYAYGFGDHDWGRRDRYVGHNGGAPGISADFSVYPILGYTLVVLANYDGAALPVSQHIRQLINAFEQRKPTG